MPVMLNVSDVLGLDAGDVVPGVKGTVKIVFDRKNGTKGDREWSVQTGFLKEVDGTEEIKFKAWDKDDLKGLTGKTVWLVSKQGKTGLTGLKVEDDEYQGKTERVLVIKGGAEIAKHDGTAVPDKRVPREAVPANDDDVPMEWPEEKAKAPEPAPKAEGSTWKEIGERIRRIGAFQAAAMVEVLTHVIPAVERKTGIRIEDYQAVQAMTATLMIEYGKVHGTTAKPEAWKGYIEE